MNLQLSDKIMLLQPINIVYHKNASITIVLGAMVMLLLFSSCSGKKKELGDAITERDSMAVMDTRGVTTLVSDSGVTRYRINTEEWLVFDRKNPPYWAFEKGVYLEKFDSIFQVEASIKADTAYFFNKEGDGHDLGLRIRIPSAGHGLHEPPVLRGHAIHIGRAVINTVAVVPPSRHRRTGTQTP